MSAIVDEVRTFVRTSSWLVLRDDCGIVLKTRAHANQKMKQKQWGI